MTQSSSPTLKSPLAKQVDLSSQSTLSPASSSFSLNSSPSLSRFPSIGEDIDDEDESDDESDNKNDEILEDEPLHIGRFAVFIQNKRNNSDHQKHRHKHKKNNQSLLSPIRKVQICERGLISLTPVRSSSDSKLSNTFNDKIEFKRLNLEKKMNDIKKQRNQIQNHHKSHQFLPKHTSNHNAIDESQNEIYLNSVVSKQKQVQPILHKNDIKHTLPPI